MLRSVLTIIACSPLLLAGLSTGCDKSHAGEPPSADAGSTAAESDDEETPDSGDRPETAPPCQIEIVEHEDEDGLDTPEWSAGDAPNTVHVAVEERKGIPSGDVKMFWNGDLGPFAVVEKRIGIGGPDAPLAGHVQLVTRPLWKVDCESPEDTEILAKKEDVDFSRSIVDWDRRVIYAAARRGLVAVDLETGALTRLVEVSERKSSMSGGHCWNDTGYIPTDVPMFLDEDRRELVFKRGGPCGYEAAWEYLIWRVKLSDSGTDGLESRPLHWPSDLATGPDDTIWLADGADATLQMSSEFAADGLLKSTDDGRSWAVVTATATDDDSEDNSDHPEPDGPVAVEADDGPVDWTDASPRIVVPSQNSPARLLVVGHARYASAAGAQSGKFLYTDDGGRTWWKVNRPSGPDNDYQAVWTVESTDGSLADLRLWTIPHEQIGKCKTQDIEGEQPASCPADVFIAWRTDDGGASWQKMPKSPPPPKPTLSLTTPGGAELTVDSAAGRVLRDPSDSDETSVVFPKNDE